MEKSPGRSAHHSVEPDRDNSGYGRGDIPIGHQDVPADRRVHAEAVEESVFALWNTRLTLGPTVRRDRGLGGVAATLTRDSTCGERIDGGVRINCGGVRSLQPHTGLPRGLCGT